MSARYRSLFSSTLAPIYKVPAAHCAMPRRLPRNHSQPTPPLWRQNARVSQEVAALEDFWNHLCESRHFHTAPFHISLTALSFLLSPLVSLLLRQNQCPQNAGYLCTDDGPDGMTTYPLSPCIVKAIVVCLALRTTATPLVVVLGAHITNAFRICMR
jgi:hypothetical protein